VVPLVLATGAGAEMRHTLGVAVFSGMLGVTLFGIFLTPIFFYVIQWLSDLRGGGPKVVPAAPDGTGHAPTGDGKTGAAETGVREKPGGAPV
jgi:hypothetical protein